MADEMMLPGWVDNDGTCLALDPETWNASGWGLTVNLTAAQRAEVKHAWEILCTEPGTPSVMYDCDGKFFRVVRLAAADYATVKNGVELPPVGPRESVRRLRG